MTELLVRRTIAGPDGTILSVTPEAAGWSYVGFEVLSLTGARQARRESAEREVCVVPISGRTRLDSPHGEWTLGRDDPWGGPPDAVYLPPGSGFSIRATSGESEVALCWAPAPAGGASPRLLRGDEIQVETRGYGAQERYIHPILMADRDAESLLVCEVLTPAGHWSSYPPHKHDQDDPPQETVLEETYYHRISPSHGFGLQRVYTEDRSLDESLSFEDRDCVLVPRGYHTVSAPPGYDVYYLNVMAGPSRSWAVRTDPDHEWTLSPSATSQR